MLRPILRALTRHEPCRGDRIVRLNDSTPSDLGTCPVSPLRSKRGPLVFAWKFTAGDTRTHAEADRHAVHSLRPQRMGGSFFHDVGGCSMRALMCEYCGCQQIATIAELTREHDAVVALVGQIKTSLPDRRRDDVAESCQQILAILAVHTVVEEEGLFPEMT